MPRRREKFQFKQFSVSHNKSSMKVGTDGVLLGAWVQNNGEKQVLDVGTGTGLVALMLAQRFPKAVIKGIDIEPGSVEEAKDNFRNSPWPGRLEAELVSLQTFARRGKRFDLVVSNPPYFNEGTQSPSRTRHRARHSEALSHQELILCSQQVLTGAGKLAVILPALSRDAFIEQAAGCGLFLHRVLNFYPMSSKPVERAILQFHKEEGKIHEEDLCQYTDNGNWTDAYKALTKSYYLAL